MRTIATYTKLLTLILLSAVCPTLIVRADTGKVVMWDMGGLTGSPSDISSGEGLVITLVEGSFSEKTYEIGSKDNYTQLTSKGYTEDAIFRIPVFSTSDKVTITCHRSWYFDVSNIDDTYDGGNAATDAPVSYTFSPKAADVTNGYVEVECGKNTYFNLGTFFTSISVKYTEHDYTSRTLSSTPDSHGLYGYVCDDCGAVSDAYMVMKDKEPFQSDADFQLSSITYGRTLSPGTWGTIVLPFVPDDANGLEFYALNEVTADEVLFTQVPFTDVQAGTPYLYKNISDKDEFTLTATDATLTGQLTTPEPTSGMHLVGVYQKQTFTSDNTVYGLKDNEFLTTTGKLTMNPFRAYLKSEQASVPMTIVIETATGIASRYTSPEAQSRHAYNLQGQAVTAGYKGLVIINGRKYMKK